MKYGVCHITIAPLRFEASDKAEMTSQVLYGESFKVLELRKSWSRIRLAHDSYEGWIDNKQYIEVKKEVYQILSDKKSIEFSLDPIGMTTHADLTLSTIFIGSATSSASFLKDVAQPKSGSQESLKRLPKSNLIDTALLFLNAPYLWGGRSTVGIDCSGFTQLVYRLNGYDLSRDASQQAEHGDILSFIEESDPGDLAFFDNAEGKITHVGIIMKDNYIIHAHGKVRIDRLDQSGIFNLEQQTHSHKLRMIKQIL